MNEKKRVIVLGIHDGHNAGAALIIDGKVAAAINEERLINIKNYSGVPHQSIKKVFAIAQVKPAEVTEIAIGSFLRLDDPMKEKGNITHILAEAFAPYLHQKWFVHSSIKFLHLFRKKEELMQSLDEIGIREKPLRFIEHHIAHAACAYYQRPWDEKTLILTLDGMGDGLSATVSIGQGFKMNRIAETSFYDSLGNNLFSEITAYLGMKRWEHEYKVMGLAPYGRDDGIRKELQKVIRVNPNHPLEFENISGHYLKKMQNVYRIVLQNKRFDNISYATQAYFEELVIAWVKNAIKETKVHRIVCSGGSFLNVKVNKLIRELDQVQEVFFYPAAEDGGSAVGAGLETYYRYCEENNIKPARIVIEDIYYGQEFSNEEVSEFIKSKRIKKAKKVTAKEIAKFIKDGNIVARFSGRDEYGPRALGNRSILADPRNLSIVRKINFAIKQRDFWMPFAPAILDSERTRYFKNSRFAPYMIEAFDTKEAGKEIIAGLHPYDLTGRPQTVNEWNPGLKSILEEFKRQTGVGGLLNTSFNIHGYPLCGTLESALWTFKNSHLDGLLLNDFLIEK